MTGFSENKSNPLFVLVYYQPYSHGNGTQPNKTYENRIFFKLNLFCILFIFFLNALHKRNTEKQKVQKKNNLKTKREITKESSLHAIYNKNRIYKITKGRVTKFTKAKKKLKYGTAV